jgi:hypothetical protein
VQNAQALILLGEPSETGQEVVDVLAADEHLLQCFSPAELRQLLELERRAMVSAKDAR